MKLHVTEVGSGSRIVVLLHGMMGSRESWWRVTRALVERGCRVLAIDLPGHGASPRDAHLTIESAAMAVVEAVRAATTTPPAVAIGHSLGGVVLAAAAADLGAAHVVLVDAIPALVGEQDRHTVAEQYERDRVARTSVEFLASRPGYSSHDAEVEARAARAFDPATTAALVSGRSRSWSLPGGSIVVRADPSSFVPDADARALIASGVDVRGIRGARHSVWFGHFDEFVAALPEVFAW